MMLVFVFKRLENQKIADGCLERVEPQSLLEQVFGRGEVGEEGAPGSQLGLARALYHDF